MFSPGAPGSKWNALKTRSGWKLEDNSTGEEPQAGLRMTDSELSSFVGVAFWVASLIEEEDILGAANRKLKAKIRRQVTENPILQSVLMLKSIWVHHLYSD